MYCAIDGEVRVWKGYENMRQPFGFSGTTAAQASRSSVSGPTNFHFPSSATLIM